ncbi:AbrB/MazE/SpoVT family DNA-binding domain-containing protein [Methanolobus halotolerans]|uniref:AbrB family transcriptional regulator n=1 Tax=Methanolobus halotolerans TaxID=2052935 RepID=A0A4E0QPZ4_9EURY|nr:AbrB/MazE/SpoVT family DNA-binding domain-containing protein [Methanolobus halotolerans]TGC06645.1 AbrB family transcriptional regulator [Methanolobus halotolerans]
MPLIEVRSATVTKKGQITLPREFRELNLGESDKAAILVYDDRIEIRPLASIEKDLECAILSQESLAESWNTPEDDEAWKYLEEIREQKKHDSKMGSCSG